MSLDEARAKVRALRNATPSTNGHHKPAGDAGDESAPAAIDTADDVAGIADLKKAGAALEWVWEGWIQRRALTLVGAEGGTGKTRFAADLVRRIRHKKLWPDGPAVASYDGPTVALWVVSDNHHGEMVTLCEAFGIADCVKLNASPADPYGGVSLESVDDFRALERRVQVTKPLILIVDTVGNATDLNLSKQEDAKAFYWPLQVIARRQNVACLCLTHLNAAGTVLGRRGVEKVRTVIRMTASDIADTGCKRRLEVTKSNGKYPPPLGMTMGDAGNEFDADPPPAPERGGEPLANAPRKPAHRPADESAKCTDWLAVLLLSGPQRVAELRTAAEQAGYSAATLYRAKNKLRLTESGPAGSKMWGFPSDAADDPIGG